MPKPTEIERKFRIWNFDPSFVPLDAAVLNITQDYLIGDEKIERRVRQVEMGGQKSYYYTEKSETGRLGTRHEEERLINFERYEQFLVLKDTNLRTIKKTRYCFIVSGKKFELDIYNEPENVSGLVIIEVELSNIDEKIEFPLIWELEEVTGDDRYKNRNLAK